MLICYSTLEFIRSDFIDLDRCPWVLLIFFLGLIQVKHMDFLIPQDWEILWWGCQLVAHTCHQSLINYSLQMEMRGVCIKFIISALIDNDTCPWVWLQIVCGMYTDRTYGFTFPAGLGNILVVGAVWRFYLTCGFSGGGMGRRGDVGRERKLGGCKR